MKRTLALREKEVEDLRGVQDAYVASSLVPHNVNEVFSNRALASRVQELEAMEESMRQCVFFVDINPLFAESRTT